LQRAITGISPRVLSNELKELELNGFVKRNVFTQTPVIVEYEATEYADTLEPIMEALGKWGAMHKNRLKEEMKREKMVAA
jgi:DNA-binding HxlR family transcriptional regulator